MKYFKELDDDKIDKPYLIERYNDGITITSRIPYEFFIKHKSVLSRIHDLDKTIELVVIREALKEQRELMLGYDRDDENDRYSFLGHKICEMVNQLAYTYGDASYDLEMTLHFLFDERQDDFLKISKLINSKKDYDYDDILDILFYYQNLLGLLKLTNDDLLKDINTAIEDVKKYRTRIDKTEYRTYPLPDSWYILPETHEMEACLFNTTGKYGHKEVTLDYLFSNIFWDKAICTQDAANYHYQRAKEINNRDFVEKRTYMSEIKMGLSIYKDPHILDSTGITYGLHELALKYQQSSIEYYLEFLDGLVPNEKKREFYEFLREHSKHFNILDSNGLPTGFHEILNKIFEYSNVPTNSGLIIDRYTNAGCFYILNEILNSIIYESKIDLEAIDGMSPLIYNQNAKKLVVGNEMAHGLVIQFFSDLYRDAKDYNACLDYLRNYRRDEILVRACGFNKVVRQRKGNDCYKEIITSNPNYEEEFKEYEEHGWKITFLSPIKLDYHNQTLRDMDSYYKVKKYHKKN